LGCGALVALFEDGERRTVHQSVLEGVDAEEDENTCNSISISPLKYSSVSSPWCHLFLPLCELLTTIARIQPSLALTIVPSHHCQTDPPIRSLRQRDCDAYRRRRKVHMASLRDVSIFLSRDCRWLRSRSRQRSCTYKRALGTSCRGYLGWPWLMRLYLRCDWRVYDDWLYSFNTIEVCFIDSSAVQSWHLRCGIR